ncbi:MAG TPA: THUMP domain-containing protein [Anaeromyxobacteraceae bacterium]
MRFFATCARGTEGALRRELAALRLRGVRGGPGGVSFEGDLEAGMRACLHARTPMRVLLELAAFRAGDAASLYDGARSVAWSDWLGARTTLAVDAAVRDAPALSHSGFAALKVKDAVVDALRDRLGARPDVDPKDPDVRIALHLAGEEATLSLDLAGEPLHKRGWRVAAGPAPLKETLAAAVLLLGGVAVDLPFLDPMCGSGTLAIEQALRARGIPPGLSRPMGFQRWPAYRGALQSTWDRMKEAARAAALPRAPAPVVARDLHPRALEAVRRNAEASGVAGDVRIEPGDAREAAPFADRGSFCTNPPYGERLAGPPAREGRRDEALRRRKLEGLYRGLAGAAIRFHGWSAVLLSGNPLIERAMPLRPQVSHRLWNGPLEVRMLKYRIP